MTRTGRGVLVLAVLAGAGAGLASLWRDAQARERGAALYEGRVALAGRPVGHETALPAVATRCANCHQGAAAIGGALDARRLADAQPRRGGPATRYDAAALCQLLRTGIDPGQIIIDTAMPRYDVTDTQCTDLWAHLTSR